VNNLITSTEGWFKKNNRKKKDMSENQEKWKKQSRNQKTKTSKQTKKKNC
jgi:hypothetical protein